MSSQAAASQQGTDDRPSQKSSEAAPQGRWLNSRASTWAALAVILILAGWLRIRHLSAISFWFDEACSWRISQFPLSEMLDAITRDAHPPLYYFVLKSWMGIFGNSVLAARSLSVMCGLVTVWLAWRFCLLALDRTDATGPLSPAFGQRTRALLAALFIAITPLQIELSFEARSYALGTLLALSAGICLLHAVRRPAQVRGWIGFTVAAAALSFTHYYGLFTVAAFYLFLLSEIGVAFWRDRRGNRAWHLLLGTFVTVWIIQCAWIPWFATFAFQRSRANEQLWMRPLTQTIIDETCWKVLAGGKFSAVWIEWEWLAPVLWVAMAVLLFLRAGTGGRLAACCALIPLLGSILYGYSIRNILEARYLVFADLYLLIGIALLPMRRSWRSISTVLIIAFVVCWSVFWSRQFYERRNNVAAAPGTQAAIGTLNEQRKSELVIVSSPFIYTIAQAYLTDKQNVFTQYYGDHRASILSGPPLRSSDYAEIRNLLAARPEHVWTVNALGLFHGDSKVRLPQGYERVSAAEFPERFGFEMTLQVQEYRWHGAPSRQ